MLEGESQKIVYSDGLRVNTGIKPYQDIGVYYDPMISKLIVHGDNQEEANAKLITAFKQYKIAGVPTNIDFLVKCAENPVFQEAGAINTGFLEEYAEDVSVDEDSMEPSSEGKALVAFAVLLQLENRIGVRESRRSKIKVSIWKIERDARELTIVKWIWMQWQREMSRTK